MCVCVHLRFARRSHLYVCMCVSINENRFFAKKNTFSDLIACAEHLVAQDLTTPQRMSLEGRSAGGLLVGAVLNMRPDLFNSVIAGTHAIFLSLPYRGCHDVNAKRLQILSIGCQVYRSLTPSPQCLTNPSH